MSARRQLFTRRWRCGAIAARGAPKHPYAIAVYLDELALEQGFVFTGPSLVGSEMFTVPSRKISTEKTVARALDRHQHFAQLSYNEVTLAVILSRKGDVRDAILTPLSETELINTTESLSDFGLATFALLG
ncbi:MAG: hypothetical protein ACJAXW_000601 [Candidatus Azotimanducaceae bacterium]|jgi:hypothetical protein